MHVYKKLYCDENTQKEKNKILRKMRYHGAYLNAYAITLAGGNDMFDIIPVHLFRQKHFPTKDLHVMGLAADYDSAVCMVQEMIQELSSRYDTYYFKEKLLAERGNCFTGYIGK